MTSTNELREETAQQLKQFFLMNGKGIRQIESIAKSLIENQLEIFKRQEIEESPEIMLDSISASIGSHATVKESALLMRVFKRQLSEKYGSKKHDPNDSYDDQAEKLSNHISKIIEQTMTGYEFIKPEDVHFRLISIYLFAATHGGLCHAPSLKALITKLTLEQKPLKQIGDLVFIDLHFKCNDYETNERNDNGDKVTLKRWYPDALTLSVIHGFLSIKNSIKSSPVEQKIIYQNLLKQCQITSNIGNLSLTVFLKACALYSFRHPQSHLSFCLKNYATGVITSASVSNVCFENLHTNSNQSTLSENKALAKALNSAPAYKRKNISSNSAFSKREFTKDLLIACKPFTKDRHKRSAKDALFSLSQVRAKYESMPHAAEIFEAWISHNLSSSNWINATAERYISAICEAWLDVAGDQDMSEGDGADMQALYEHILDTRANEDTQAIDALRRILFYANNSFDVNLPDSFDSNDKGTSHVRSQIVSESNFQRLRKDINERFKNEPLPTLQLIDIALLLCRRLFMRPSEVFRLLVNDVEYSEQCWIRVRTNCWRSLKSVNASRKIPLKIFLLEDELIRFMAFIKQRRLDTENRKNGLLFSLLPNADAAISIQQISKHVGQLLTSYIGEPVCLYSLRHSGISNLQLTLCGGQEINKKYNYYSMEKIEEIKQFLTSYNSDVYYQIAKLAGHLSPCTTLSTYAHFTDRLTHDALKNIQSSLTLKAWCKAVNMRPSSITKALNVSDQISRINASNIVKLILNRIRPYCAKLIEKKEPERLLLSMPPPTICFNVFNSHKILEKFDEGKSPMEISWEIPISIDRIKGVIDTARAIKDRYVTSRGQSRLYPANNVKLAPAMPPSTREKIDFDRMVRIFESQRLNITSFRRAVDYTLNNISLDHPEISFRTQEELKVFMSGLGDLIEPRNLHIALTPLHSKEKECLMYWSKIIKAEIHLLLKCKKNKNMFPVGQLSLQYLHPEHEQMKKQHNGKVALNKYGSNSFRCALHMFAIILGTEKRQNSS